MVIDQLRETARELCRRLDHMNLTREAHMAAEALRAALDAEPEPAGIPCPNCGRYFVKEGPPAKDRDLYDQDRASRGLPPAETGIHDALQDPMATAAPAEQKRLRDEKRALACGAAGLEYYERLCAMRDDSGLTWDLSGNDQAAFRWALEQIDGHAAALAAAEARGLEWAAQWHASEEEKCKQRMKEMAENPLRLARCKEDGSLHMMMGLAAEHREYGAAIRALKEES